MFKDKNILFYGNCQMIAIKDVIKASSKFNYVKSIICFNTQIQEEEFLELIQMMDVIVMSYITTNYRNLDYLSSQYIIDNAKKSCQIFIIPSIYFEFYYPDLQYLRIDGKTIHKPIDYHYKGLIETYKKGGKVEDFIKDYLENQDLYSGEYLDELARSSLKRLKEKENEIMSLGCLNLINKNQTENKNKNKRIHPILISDYIEKNYKNKLLFYSMNHPSKYIFQELSRDILLILEKETKTEKEVDLDLDLEKDPLKTPKCFLYKSIKNMVSFNLDDHKPLMNDLENPLKITQKYFEEYQSIF